VRINRWWIYQRERFPIFAHGPLILIFSLSALSCSVLLRGENSLPGIWNCAVAVLTPLLFFLQLRIIDEFKDFDEDSRYRPYRPVPRGLVSLRELGILGLLSALIQAALAWSVDSRMLWLILLVWAYLGLMSCEFLIGEWLKKRPLLLMLSHMVIIPLIDLYATACDWMSATGRPPAGLHWFLLVSYFNGMVLEIGRKTRSPASEEPGVITYSAAWGGKLAIAAWLCSLLATFATAVMAAASIHSINSILLIFTILSLSACWIAWGYLREPEKNRGKVIEAFSGIWILLMYLNLGVLPLVWRWYAATVTMSP